LIGRLALYCIQLHVAKPVLEVDWLSGVCMLWQMLANLSQRSEELGIDLRERVKTALDNFVAHDMFTE
jgi:hypothetical protein